MKDFDSIHLSQLNFLVSLKLCEDLLGGIMRNHALEKWFHCCFVFCMYLMFNPLQAASHTFEASTSLPIIQSFVEVYPPGKICPIEPLSRKFPGFRNFWCVRNVVVFDNGLYASSTYYYDDFSYRESLKNRRYSGRVNIIAPKDKEDKRDFALLFENGTKVTVDLWADMSQMSLDLPRIRSLAIFPQTISHWFYNETKVEYVVELNDGTSWKTPLLDTEQDSAWIYPWEPSSRIVRIGNSTDPILINLDTVYEDYPLIAPKDFLRTVPVN